MCRRLKFWRGGVTHCVPSGCFSLASMSHEKVFCSGLSGSNEANNCVHSDHWELMKECCPAEINLFVSFSGRCFSFVTSQNCYEESCFFGQTSAQLPFRVLVFFVIFLVPHFSTPANSARFCFQTTAPLRFLKFSMV